MKNNTINILVIDDEEDICEILKFNLESEGFHTDTVLSTEEAMTKKLEKYQMFLIDIMMKGKSGYTLAHEIRKNRNLDTPIFFISAKNSENDKLTGFSVGADDYITKPFSIKEVIARIKAVLKRAEGPFDKNTQTNITISGLQLDAEKKRLIVDGVKVDLTPIEFQLLFILMKNPGRIYGRDQILEHIWRDVNVAGRTIDVHMTRLRKKMGKYGPFLISRKGYGYCFEIDK
jgi:two-component system, OmpR family, alkaline phosphatase synthesis response regulator PhoP